MKFKQTLSDSIELKDLPASLRHQQSFHFDTYKKGILDYLKIHLKEGAPERENEIVLPFRKKKKRIRSHILIGTIILLLLSFAFFTPKIMAIKKGKEALEYCDKDNKGSFQCNDALKKAYKDMIKAGVSEDNDIRKEVENRIKEFDKTNKRTN